MVIKVSRGRRHIGKSYLPFTHIHMREARDRRIIEGGQEQEGNS